MSLPTSPPVATTVPVAAVRAAPTFHWVGVKRIHAKSIWPCGLGPAGVERPATGLQEFEEAVCGATNRILIMDPHFDFWCGLASIWDAIELTSAQDIRILSGVLPELNRELAASKRKLPSRVLLGHLQAGQIHDRYAFVDDDLWHFGATVGGGFHVVSSASHGWIEEADELYDLFRNLWDRQNK